MITWILVAVSCGAIAYSARIVMDYIAYEHELLPAIQRLDEVAENLLREANWESEEKDRLRERLQALRETVEELQTRSAKMKSELQAEQKLNRRIELEANRQQLKQRKKVAVS